MKTTTPQPDPFDQIHCDLNDIYEDLQYYCHNTTRETTGRDSYRINVPLKGFQKEDIQVRMKHRVVSITASGNGGS
ncbi:Hsp20/alpha crystallin family protein, partial [Clostridium perfringens]|nr:Hsp20/alpha crystallin family protein [Clostridium perfringens]